MSDFVFGFSADPGHDLLEIIRKSRVASQARVDAARQVGDTVRGMVSDVVLGFSWFLRAVFETKNKV